MFSYLTVYAYSNTNPQNPWKLQIDVLIIGVDEVLIARFRWLLCN